MVTKTYLKPTYIPTYLCDSCDSCDSSDSSKSNDSSYSYCSDSSDQQTFLSPKNFFRQKNYKTFFPKKNLTKKVKMWQILNNLNFTKLKNSKRDKTQKLQMWQN